MCPLARHIRRGELAGPSIITGPVAPPPPLTPDVKRRGIPRPDPDNSGFFPVETGGMGNTHTHIVAARFVAALPISRDNHGGPAEADLRHWEPPRDSPVPPQGAPNLRPATEVDYAQQASSPPGGGPTVVTPPGAHPGVPTGQAPRRRTRGIQHPHGATFPTTSAHARREAERSPPARP